MVHAIAVLLRRLVQVDAGIGATADEGPPQGSASTCAFGWL